MSEEQGEGYYWWWPSGREKLKIETEEDAPIFSICCAFVVAWFIAFAVLANWDPIIVVGLEVLAAILFLAGIAHSKETSRFNATLFLILLALPTLFFALMQYWKVVTGLSLEVIPPIIVLLGRLKKHASS